MGICFICANCERPLNVDHQLGGRRGKCPNCNSMLEVPTASEISEDEFRQVLTEWRSQGPKQATATPLESAQRQLESTSSSDAEDLVQPERSPNPPEFSTAGEIIESPVVLTESEKVSSGPFARLLPNDCEVLNQEQSGLWYVRPATGGQFGPADSELLKLWISEGRVTHDSYVWVEGWSDWRLASEVFISETPTDGDYGGLSVNKTRAPVGPREAYLKARKKRTMRGVIGLATGAIVVLILISVLIYVIQNRAA